MILTLNRARGRSGSYERGLGSTTRAAILYWFEIEQKREDSILVALFPFQPTPPLGTR